jgi:2-dehydro-3-deoxyphosphogluconate aldolase/(4S)-4-hydroxy-2-oxoglutarate aldolase
MTQQLIFQSRLVAILRLDDLSAATQIADTLIGAGIRALEFTLTNPESPSVVKSIRETNPAIREGNAVIGLGSVRSLEEAKIAIDFGAQFIVSPILSVPIIEYCKQNKVAVCPGAFTPTEIALAWDAGADIIKVFPARALGPSYIRDVLAPMPYLKLMPTGGVDLKNIAKYLEAGAVAVGIGGQLLDPIALQNKDWNTVAKVAQQYVATCQTELTDECK